MKKNLNEQVSKIKKMMKLNELSDREIDIIKGNPNSKYDRSAKQFQSDFKKDFLDPTKEYPNPWEKDQPRSSGDALPDTYSDEQWDNLKEKRRKESSLLNQKIQKIEPKNIKENPWNIHLPYYEYEKDDTSIRILIRSVIGALHNPQSAEDDPETTRKKWKFLIRLTMKYVPNDLRVGDDEIDRLWNEISEQ